MMMHTVRRAASWHKRAAKMAATNPLQDIMTAGMNSYLQNMAGAQSSVGDADRKSRHKDKSKGKPRGRSSSHEDDDSIDSNFGIVLQL
jgi:hypothetical protein